MKTYPLVLLAACLFACSQWMSPAVAQPAPKTPGKDQPPPKKEPAKPASGGEEEPIDGKPVKEWIKALKDKDEKARIRAAEALTGLKEGDEHVPALLEALNDPNETVRGNVLMTLRQLGNETIEKTVKTLVKNLKDQNV